jgi:hypothetical protein
VTRILVVAHRSVATPALLEAIERRSACEISLLIPDAADGRAGDWTFRHAVRLIERTSGAPVRGVLRRTDPFDAIAEALEADSYDEVVISTLPRARSRWLHRSLPRRVARLGVPVTVVTPEGELLPV